MDRPGLWLRRLIGLLFVLNLGVLLAGWGGTYWQGRKVPLVTFNADKIQMLDEVLPEGSAAVDGAGRRETKQDAPTSADCLAWNSLDADGVAQIQAHMHQLGVADSAYDLVVGMRLGWWVYIPPLADSAALRVVMEDARSKGVTDMAPVRNGVMANALALGTFPSLDGARQHAQNMAKKGLRGVRYGPRPGTGLARLVIVQDTPELRQALAADWPKGLEPNGCSHE